MHKNTDWCPTFRTDYYLKTQYWLIPNILFSTDCAPHSVLTEYWLLTFSKTPYWLMPTFNYWLWPTLSTDSCHQSVLTVPTIQYWLSTDYSHSQKNTELTDWCPPFSTNFAHYSVLTVPTIQHWVLSTEYWVLPTIKYGLIPTIQYWLSTDTHYSVLTEYWHPQFSTDCTHHSVLSTDWLCPIFSIDWSPPFSTEYWVLITVQPLFSTDCTHHSLLTVPTIQYWVLRTDYSHSQKKIVLTVPTIQYWLIPTI